MIIIHLPGTVLIYLFQKEKKNSISSEAQVLNRITGVKQQQVPN